MSRSAAVRKAAPEAGRRGRPARSNQSKSAPTTAAAPTLAATEAAALAEPTAGADENVAAAPTAAPTLDAEGQPTADGPVLTLVPPPAAEPAPAEAPTAAEAPATVGAEAMPAESAVGDAEPTTQAASATDVPEEAPAPQAASATDVPDEAAPEAAVPDEVETPSPVNYDEEGIGEVEIDGNIYRFDSGKQGTALCLSRRQEGAWRWSYLGELRWDGRDLRSKTLERSLLTRLSASLRALAEAAS